MEWRLSCENRNRVPLMYVGEIDEATVGKSSILMAASADMDEEAGGFPVRVGKYEVWNGAVDSDMVKAILASRYLQVRETTPMPHGNVDRTKFDIDMTGLVSMWKQLVAPCTSATTGPMGPWPASPSPSVSAAPPAAPPP